MVIIWDWVFLSLWAVALVWAIREGHVAKMWDVLKKILAPVIMVWQEINPPKSAPQEKAHFGAIHTYYGGHEITKAVEDIWSSISDVILAVEKQCENEVRVSKSYREKPELIYDGHPWMKFVRSGGAEYLGWDRNHVPGPTPVEQRRQQSMGVRGPQGVVFGERGPEAMIARPYRIGEKPLVDLVEHVSLEAVPNRVTVGPNPAVLAEYMLRGLLEVDEPWDDRLRNGG